jgi:hypothetical protein
MSRNSTQDSFGLVYPCTMPVLLNSSDVIFIANHSKCLPSWAQIDQIQILFSYPCHQHNPLSTQALSFTSPTLIPAYLLLSPSVPSTMNEFPCQLRFCYLVTEGGWCLPSALGHALIQDIPLLKPKETGKKLFNLRFIHQYDSKLLGKKKRQLAFNSPNSSENSASLFDYSHSTFTFLSCSP